MRIKRTGLLPRKEYVRDARLFIVATEGEKTEEQYLAIFPESNRIKVKVLSTGPDGKSAAKYVLERMAEFEEQYDLGPEDERWLMVRYRPAASSVHRRSDAKGLGERLSTRGQQSVF